MQPLFAGPERPDRRPFNLHLMAAVGALYAGSFFVESLAAATFGAQDSRPNIVVILADDLGAHDTGCQGADLIETPHIDLLGRRGVRFTQAYAASPVCTPTRAALLTGKHPARLRMTIWSEGSLQGPTDRKLLQAPSRHDLSHRETTLARILQNAGYLTASIGKWHLGDAAHAPETHGFDVNIGGTHWGAPQTFFSPYRGTRRFGGEFRYVPHLEFGEQDEYLTDRLTDEALRVIDRAAERKQPFFLYLAHHAPHTPIEAKQQDIDYFESRLQPGDHHQHPVYAAMVRSLDDSVGRVMQRLENQGLADSTIVIFASDNGGYIATEETRNVPITSNFPLRSGKGSLYEGGLRVPLIVLWPKQTPSGVVCSQPVVLTDLFPTVLTVTGLKPPETTACDGMDLTPLLKAPEQVLDRDALYFHYPHYYHAPKTTPCSAVRVGDWKLIEYFEDGRIELFDLKTDPGESQDLAAAQPQRVTQMLGMLRSWRNSTAAAMPTPNPAFTNR